MLTPGETAKLNWNPLVDVGRGSNVALTSLGYDAKGGLRYLMGCGHRSIPRLTVCERGCKTCPNWKQPLTLNTRLQALERFSRRHDPERLPRQRVRALQARASVLGRERGYGFVPRRVA